MKIAFASCIDPIDDDEQVVWDKVAEHSPDALLLLGDNVYMDYGNSGFPIFSDHPLYCSRAWDEQRFADELYRRYLLQSQVSSFRNLVNDMSVLGTTWDDHDFAWNSSHGVGESDYAVPENKRLISRALHLQFRNWLRTTPLPNEYPDQPDLADMLSGEDAGIEEIIEVDHIRIIMVDGRYYREAKKEDGSSQVLGEQQREWLMGHLHNWEGVKILCSGATLTRGGDGWDQYSDLSWLAQCDLNKTVVLTGDIHLNATRKHRDLGGVFEVTSSGAARPKLGGATGNFGILEIDNNRAVSYLIDDEDEVTRRVVL